MSLGLDAAPLRRRLRCQGNRAAGPKAVLEKSDDLSSNGSDVVREGRHGEQGPCSSVQILGWGARELGTGSRRRWRIACARRPGSLGNELPSPPFPLGAPPLDPEVRAGAPADCSSVACCGMSGGR